MSLYTIVLTGSTEDPPEHPLHQLVLDAYHYLITEGEEWYDRHQVSRAFDQGGIAAAVAELALAAQRTGRLPRVNQYFSEHGYGIWEAQTEDLPRICRETTVYVALLPEVLAQIMPTVGAP